jgi:hypothetical protein
VSLVYRYIESVFSYGLQTFASVFELRFTDILRMFLSHGLQTC